ncbi:MAG: T9SS type A sorting domain-containing protein [Bacteroidota bacterium]
MLQANDLGLNLINVRFDSRHILRTDNPLGVNAVADVCAMAQAEVLDVCVDDPTLGTSLLGERIMLHPESGYDFYNRGDYTTAAEELFTHFPLEALKASRPLLEPDENANCVVIDSGRGEISTPSFARIEELSVVTNVNPVSGRYHLSVIVKDHSETWSNPPNDATAVLHVHVETTTSWGDPRTITFALPGTAFYWDTSSTAAIRDSAFEYVLGNLELRRSETRLFFVPFSSLFGGWSDTTAFCGKKIVEGIGDSAAIYDMLQNFNIRISAGNTGAKFLLDAVCLTNPGTLGLYQPDIAGVLDAHRSHQGNMVHRMEAIVRDTATTAGPFPNLTMMGFPEQIPRYACWVTSRLGRLLLNEITGGSVMPYITTSSSTDLNSAGAMHADFVSGAYYYPISSDHLRPTLNTTAAAQYYSSITQPDSMGFVEMGMRLRTFVDRRNQFQPKLPWIPWIQNHSQLNDSLPPNYWDQLSHREPSAAELRQECNTVLALGARGIMFYSFASIPWKTSAPFWPPDTNTWRADTTGGSPRPLDRNMGLLGFLADQNLPRRCDWNGEDKWDSTRTYISTFLHPIGDLIVENDLRWLRHKFWHLDGYGETIAGTNEFVRMVFSERQDLALPRDSMQNTWVQISEFEDKDRTKYLFVLNSRTHPEGQRHITVKLAPGGGGYEWKVTEVRGPGNDGDIWIVRPSDTPDASNYANGFTDYLAAGQAKLYRIEMIRDETVDFTSEDLEACPDRSIYIEPAAMLRLKSTDVLAFAPGNGLYCDGALRAVGTIFRPCDTEGIWEGIVSRNGASAYFEDVTVCGAGIITGSDATDTLDEGCTIQGTTIALTNMGGTLYSNSTESSNVSGHLLSFGNGFSRLVRDHSVAASSTSSTALEITQNSLEVQIDESEFSNYQGGIYLWEAILVGDADQAFPSDGGNNSICASEWGLIALAQSSINLGETRSVPSWESSNEIVVSSTGYHAWSDESEIWARQCWWIPYDNSSFVPIIIAGDVWYDNPLTSDPIPFTGGSGETMTGGGTMSKSLVVSPPPGIRELVRVALAQRHAGTVRHLIGQFLQSVSASTADFRLLRFLHRALRNANGRGGIDSLLTLCLTRTDMESKLLAADIAAEDSLYTDALEILNAYNFASSTTLQKRAMLRKALLYPRAWRGGYQDGLLVLDSLRSLNDSLLLPFIDLYPILYSRLSHPESNTVPKRAGARLIDRVLPTGIDVWPNYPNPFADITSFTFKLGEATHVRLAVFDAIGREVAIVTDADYERGVHSAVLRSGSLPNGLYFYRLITDAGVIQRKMMLLR